MDDVFEDFATLDTRIQQACKYVVKRVPEIWPMVGQALQTSSMLTFFFEALYIFVKPTIAVKLKKNNTQ